VVSHTSNKLWVEGLATRIGRDDTYRCYSKDDFTQIHIFYPKFVEHNLKDSQRPHVCNCLFTKTFYA